MHYPSRKTDHLYQFNVGKTTKLKFSKQYLERISGVKKFAYI